MKGLLKGLHWVLGDDRPMGLSEEEFQDAKARHEAGELTLGEVELLREKLELAESGEDEQDKEEPDKEEPDEDSMDDISIDNPFSSEGWYAHMGQRMEL